MSDRRVQEWNPRQYADNARFVTDLGMPVVDLLGPRPGERILDLGCGDGPLTAKLAALGCSVIGVDGSPEMIAAACALGLDARVMDGQALTFDGEFDAVFSNAALHWMPRGGAVIAGVWRALKPGGRFVGEFGGRDNVAAIVNALNAARSRRGLATLAPWFNPGPEEYGAMLGAQGFRVTTMLHFPRPTPVPGHMQNWIDTFAGAFLADMRPQDRAALINEAAEELRPKLLDAAGIWHVDYVRLRFAAHRP